MSSNAWESVGNSGGGLEKCELTWRSHLDLLAELRWSALWRDEASSLSEGSTGCEGRMTGDAVIRWRRESINLV